MDTINRFTTADGRHIYSLPVRSFPNLTNNVMIVDDGSRQIMIDCGSGFHHANDDLVAGFKALNDAYATSFSFESIDALWITHGHIDHFGGLPFLRQHNPHLPVGIHILDRRVISNHEERVMMAVSRLKGFLLRAGVAEPLTSELINVYLFSKSYFQSQPIDFTLDEGDTLDDIGIIHVPGHCPGLVCLRVDDILLSTDHILSRITPHQAPESITTNMGLGHYLHSLAKVEKLEGISLAIGAHEEPIADFKGRIAEIRQSHDKRLGRVLHACTQPRTITEINDILFPGVKSFHILLALEETGAHVEYLYERGMLIAANPAAIEKDPYAVIQYVRV